LIISLRCFIFHFHAAFHTFFAAYIIIAIFFSFIFFLIIFFVLRHVVTAAALISPLLRFDASHTPRRFLFLRCLRLIYAFFGDIDDYCASAREQMRAGAPGSVLERRSYDARTARLFYDILRDDDDDRGARAALAERDGGAAQQAMRAHSGALREDEAVATARALRERAMRAMARAPERKRRCCSPLSAF